jgi:hypothetical protein
MSTKRNRKRRSGQGYDPSPPACANCIHYKPPIQGKPGGQPYSPPTCTYGTFTVKPRGVCDVWTGADGSTLE